MTPLTINVLYPGSNRHQGVLQWVEFESAPARFQALEQALE
jgi:hypothetical protein